MRIRTLEIIKKLIQNRDYLKKEFVKLIKKVSDGANAYEGYLTIKNNLKEEKKFPINEAEKLYEYLKKDLARVRGMV